MHLLTLLRPAAYLDPGSGSYLLQLLVAAVLGAGLAVRMYWGRIKTIFGRKNPDELTENPTDKPDELTDNPTDKPDEQ